MNQHIQFSQITDAAMGRTPCDLIFRDVTFLDVFSNKWQTGDVSVFHGTIVGLEPGLKAHKEIQCKGKYLVPGFIDAHVHVESSMMMPHYFESSVLPKGTTTAICDPHEIANVMGTKGIELFLQSSEALQLDLWVMLSSCVPSSLLETNGAGTITSEHLKPLMDHPRVLGLAEMMNMYGVLHNDEEVHRKLELFAQRNVDGHSPLLRGKELSAYIASGISTCHECSDFEEAKEKITKGMRVWIREGSVAKDLDTLAPLLTLETSTMIGFCTDDRNPYDIALEGHIDHLVRTSIAKGIPQEVVYRAASWSPAQHYGLTQGRHRFGAIAPGFEADLILLDDAATCAIADVYKKGIHCSEIETSLSFIDFDNSVRATAPTTADLKRPEGNVRIIGIQEGKLITDHCVDQHDAAGVRKLTVLERHHGKSKPANAYVRGFGELTGAIASSVGHDAHNLIVVGDTEENMAVALEALIESGGGFAVASQNKVLSQLPLPLAGLISNDTPEETTLKIKNLKEASHSIGCALQEPFLQLAFLSLPVIPDLKLTDKGLVDVGTQKLVDVRAS